MSPVKFMLQPPVSRPVKEENTPGMLQPYRPYAVFCRFGRVWLFFTFSELPSLESPGAPRSITPPP